MSLKLKKIYVDTRYRTPDSISTAKTPADANNDWVAERFRSHLLKSSIA